MSSFDVAYPLINVYWKEEPARESDVFIEYHNMRLFMRALISCRREIFTTRRDKHTARIIHFGAACPLDISEFQHFDHFNFVPRRRPTDYLCFAAPLLKWNSRTNFGVVNLWALLFYTCAGGCSIGKKSFVRTGVIWSWSAHESNLQCQIWVMDGLCLKATCLQFP